MDIQVASNFERLLLELVPVHAANRIRLAEEPEPASRVEFDDPATD